MRLGFQGFRVAPQPGVSVNGRIASSESVVLPMITAPPARSRRTVSPSAVAGVASYPRCRTASALPSTSTLSLIAIGTPSRGADSPPDRARVGGVGLGQGALAQHLGERVHLGAEALDPLEVELDQLARGDLAGADQLRLARSAGKREFLWLHAGILCRPSSPAASNATLSPASARRRPRRSKRITRQPSAAAIAVSSLVRVDDDGDPHGAQHREVGAESE